jgi:serine phosphatase RsbU (regulator of sigma subunit)/anti-sigma regulatory factor (Ser/Thr protein kinase)
MSAFSGLAERRSVGWVTIPLVTRAGARGALHLSLRTPRRLEAAEREWLQAMVSQCGQALERSGLFEQERRSRLRAERLQAMTALLSNALTPADVANVVADEVSTAVEPTAIAVASILDGEVTEVLAVRGDAAGALGSVLEGGPDAESPGGRVLRARRSLVVDAGELPRLFPDLADELVAAGFDRLFIVPLVAGRRANGLLVAAWDDPRQLAEDDRTVVEALAGQAGLALDRARQFESEQAIAETLQRSVLPVSLPRVDGVKLAGRYLPGSAELDVGGDWFDALQLLDGKIGLVVGDVVGKGVQAAASMAQLRNAIRAYSVERLRPPSALARLNRLANEVLDTSFATLAYLVVDPDQGVCRMSSAGHPPPVLRCPDGRVELLEGARGLPLGTGMDARYRQDTVQLPAGSVLLLYTDGLVERRGQSIDDGLAALEAAVRTGPTDPDRLLEHVLERVVGSGERADDIALLAARVLPVAPRPLDLQIHTDLDSMDLVRDALRSWLDGVDLDRAEVENVVLAAWEACANAIEHALEPTDEIVTIRAHVDDAHVRITVADTGRWASPSGPDGSGFGLKLIESLSTRSRISTAETGTTVTIEKVLTEPAASTPAG